VFDALHDVTSTHRQAKEGREKTKRKLHASASFCFCVVWAGLCMACLRIDAISDYERYSRSVGGLKIRLDAAPGADTENCAGALTRHLQDAVDTLHRAAARGSERARIGLIQIARRAAETPEPRTANVTTAPNLDHPGPAAGR